MMAGKIRWLGHAFVEFTTSDDKVIFFDPWTKDDGNPACPVGLDQIERADLVLFSHDHDDHAASVVAICKKTGDLMGGPVQSVKKLVAQGFSNEQVVNFGMGYMVGGGVELDWVKVVSTPAFHSSDTARPLGTIVKAIDGTTVYHAGDTCLFGDMELYGRLLFVDLKEKGDWPYSQRKVQGIVKRVCTRSKLRVRNPHYLWHTYVTILLMAH